jgi:hypothetical protein
MFYKVEKAAKPYFYPDPFYFIFLRHMTLRFLYSCVAKNKKKGSVAFLQQTYLPV